MAHVVICKYCREKFDRDKEPYVQVSAKRYAHVKCAEEAGVKDIKVENENISKELNDLQSLLDYMTKLLNLEFVNPRLRKQINSFVEEYGYSYHGIELTLKYFYEVKSNPIEKANGGIGIVPYVYEEAKKYYYNLWLIQNANKDKKKENFTPKDKEVTINVPRPRFSGQRKKFDFSEEEEV